MRLAVALLALCCGCSTTVEGGLRLCEYEPRDFAELESDFVTLWDLVFDNREQVRRAIHNADVMCSESVIVPGLGVVYGVTYNPTNIEIATVDPGSGMPLTLRQSALVHEWVHVALWVTEGDPDVDHGTIDGPWTPRHTALIDAVRHERITE